jgi:transposase
MMSTASKDHTIREVREMFGVSHMTVYNWRAGNVGKRKLPSRVREVDGRKRVVMPHESLMKWAAENDLKPLPRTKRKTVAER